MSRTWDPALARLVERQLRNWELARSQRRPRPEPAPSEVEDFVCVSRMVGIGDEVAAGIGARLGWPVFDKQLLEAMAGDDQVRRQIYRSMDQRDLTWWEETLNPLLLAGRAVRNDYFHRLCETLLSLARQGSAVFVGRGADRILPRDLGFRLRLIAPRDQRVARYAQAAGCGPEEAGREIARLEGERGRYLRRHFQVEATDPLRHDVILNMERLGAEQAVEIALAARRIAAAARRKEPVPAPSGGSGRGARA